MAKLKYRHHSQGFEIGVEARKGKPVVSKGLVTLDKPYKKCRMIRVDVFEEKFIKVSA